MREEWKKEKDKENSQRQAKRKHLKNYVNRKKGILLLWYTRKTVYVYGWVMRACVCMCELARVLATSLPHCICHKCTWLADTKLHKESMWQMREGERECVWCNATATVRRQSAKKNRSNGRIIMLSVFSITCVLWAIFNTHIHIQPNQNQPPQFPCVNEREP